jgi:hypothetical protein
MEITRRKTPKPNNKGNLFLLINPFSTPISSFVLNRKGISSNTIPFVGLISITIPKNNPARVKFLKPGFLIKLQQYQRNPLIAKKE